jgi:hypothetical protein
VERRAVIVYGAGSATLDYIYIDDVGVRSTG